MNHNLVKRFCTPPYSEPTDFDLKSIATAEQFLVDFEGIKLPVYSWGKGEKVLLVHGWGSRASHMTLLARVISEAGYNVFAFDAPAHSSVNNIPSKKTSNMFEYGRSISAVAKHLGSLHAVVAHSLASIAALFTLTGYRRFENFRFDSKKLVLISSPSSVEQIISSFSKSNNLTGSEKDTLRLELEKEFEFKVSDYLEDPLNKSRAEKKYLRIGYRRLGRYDSTKSTQPWF